MQKRIGLGSILALGAAVALLGMSAPAAQAQIVNGSFETGDFTGWTVVNGNSAEVVKTADGKNPVDGQYFAHLSAGQTQFTVSISQSFTALAGQSILAGAAYFQAADGNLSGPGPTRDDYGYVKILQGNVILFESHISTIGSNNSTPWTNFEYDFAADGVYTIQAGVQNAHDNSQPSSIGLDNVSLGIGGHATPATPEGSSLLMLVAGGLPFAAVPILRRRRK